MAPAALSENSWYSQGQQIVGVSLDLLGIMEQLMGYNGYNGDVPSGKRLHNYGTSPLLVGKSTSEMFFLFNSKLLVYQRVTIKNGAVQYG